MKLKSMRKVFSGLVLVFMVFALVSCSSSTTDDSNGGDADGGDADGDGDGSSSGTGSGNTACNFTLGSSLYDDGASGNGEDTQATADSGLIQTADLVYLGAFRLPGEEGVEGTFSYGANAMTYYPTNDSLFITGHDRTDAFPTGSQVAEVDTPDPVNSKDVNALPTAEFIQNFADATGSFFNTYNELPRVGLAYIHTDEVGDKIYMSFGQHFHESEEDAVPTHSWFDINLSSPNPQGAWYVGNRSLYSTDAYMFEIYHTWADTNASGRYLATGRSRDGGWSGHGPALYAIAPWLEGNPPANCAQLEVTTLLQYSTSAEDANLTATANNYQHPDVWEGGAWLTDAGGKSAVIFAGTKSTGTKYWYGYIDSESTDPCVDVDIVDQFTACRNSDGTACPDTDLAGCDNPVTYRGWWSERFDAQIIFYDPANLAAVAAGSMKPYAPQPYAVLDIDEYLILQTGVEEADIGVGNYRKNRVGDIAFDRTNRRLYILEQFADGTKPVVHVWRVD